MNSFMLPTCMHFQSHPKFGKWRDKTKVLPKYDDLVILFGSTVATGQNATRPGSVVPAPSRSQSLVPPPTQSQSGSQATSAEHSDSDVDNNSTG